MKSTLNPYLIFDGNCKEVMEWYRSILGGELKLQSFADAGMAKTPEDQNRTIHAYLQNDALSFMGSDSMPGQKLVIGDNVHLSISGSDEAKLTEYFNKLAEGGKVTIPMAKQFWGDTFGMFTDKFGIHWMVNISSQEAQK